MDRTVVEGALFVLGSWEKLCQDLENISAGVSFQDIHKKKGEFMSRRTRSQAELTIDTLGSLE